MIVIGLELFSCILWVIMDNYDNYFCWGTL